jgi:beta-lactam-binding protein with PASTA domain
MSFKKFLVSKTFFLNLIAAIALVSGLLYLTLQTLNSYTRHGQSNPVPDFYNLTYYEAVDAAKPYKLKVVVIDSVFTDKIKPGAVYEQEPNPGFGVKENRTIFLTINSISKEQVILPKLTDISFRQAQVLVENSGLIIGEISYQPSEYNNLVLKVKQDSLEMLPGELLLKGSRVDFIVGRDPQNEQTPLPNLKGLKIEEAKNILTNAMLNFGVLIFDKSIVSEEDSTNAVIWRQRPDKKRTSDVKLGTSVDLWVTVDEEKINTAKELEF